MPTSSRSSSPDGGSVLIAAQSGRALAAAARRAGYAPFVVDLFGDADTRALAGAYRQVRGRFGLGLGGRAVIGALEELAAQAPAPLRGVVLGSGFERAPGLVAAIAARFTLLGTPARAVARLKDPAELAAGLQRLGIPHPAISLDWRDAGPGWLVKRQGASGGGHVRRARRRHGPLRRGAYLQREVAGTAHALAFLADGRGMVPVAFTRQWPEPTRKAPWRYGGAVEPAALPAGLAGQVEQAAAAVAAEFGVVGLASADLLVDGDRWWLLEINPRPGATLDILDRRPTPLFHRHCEACAGRLGTFEDAPAEAGAATILYAGETIADVPDLAWPAYAHDRPTAGSSIKAGGPICTIAASAADAESARAILDVRSNEIARLLQRGEDTRVRKSATVGRQPAERHRAGQAPG